LEWLFELNKHALLPARNGDASHLLLRRLLLAVKEASQAAQVRGAFIAQPKLGLPFGFAAIRVSL
jgi:hypothetical protein